jgi:formylglycine-generating enzyme required for sulfatase activity
MRALLREIAFQRRRRGAVILRPAILLGALALALPAGAVTFDWVIVGDPGNACDPQSQGCFGAVAYTYEISKYEVTNAQYAEFLNAVAATDTYQLYLDTRMPFPSLGGGITRSGASGSYTYSAIAGRENMPVNYVSFGDVLRFANWLHNGQPVGPQDSTTTEDGAYTITAEGLAANTITRNAGARIFLTSEDEWYKAAYYDSPTASYFGYPSRSNAQTTCALPTAKPNTANCVGAEIGGFTEVGSYTGSPSAYGTFDQGGNAVEWNESIAVVTDNDRGTRGGWNGSSAESLSAAFRTRFPATTGNSAGNLGFRVATVLAACENGMDDDGDDLIDYPDDPGCVDPADLSEGSAACENGVDDDGDTLIDDPADPGCSSPGDDSELSPVPCDNGLDDDNDGTIDWRGDATGDPDCYGISDLSEQGSPPPGCGIGPELGLLVAPLWWLRRRRENLRRLP